MGGAAASGWVSMGENGSLSRKQKRFVAAILESRTVRDAAELAQVSETTAWRWLGQPAFRRELARRQAAVLASVTTGLVTDMNAARGVLVEMMSNSDVADSVRVRAALGILDYGTKLFETLALAERVAALEEHMGGYQ